MYVYKKFMLIGLYIFYIRFAKKVTVALHLKAPLGKEPL